MKTLSYFAEAEEEVTNALLASRNATEFRRTIDGALQDITSGSVTHAQVGRSPYRRCVLPKPYPYSIIYLETANEIRVVAFPHHKRRTNYWKNRRPKGP